MLEKDVERVLLTQEEIEELLDGLPSGLIRIITAGG